ncbi:hypothetical protein BKA69DRAFT_1167763 [Paraphysoderma sedebokerense]|nr:hypothetical protein BKA69DRAFT_1167763 [Paraphysoderma sedebokerense]
MSCDFVSSKPSQCEEHITDPEILKTTAIFNPLIANALSTQQIDDPNELNFKLNPSLLPNIFSSSCNFRDNRSREIQDDLDDLVSTNTKTSQDTKHFLDFLKVVGKNGAAMLLPRTEISYPEKTCSGSANQNENDTERAIGTSELRPRLGHSSFSIISCPISDRTMEVSNPPASQSELSQPEQLPTPANGNDVVKIQADVSPSIAQHPMKLVASIICRTDSFTHEDGKEINGATVETPTEAEKMLQLPLRPRLGEGSSRTITPINNNSKEDLQANTVEPSQPESSETSNGNVHQDPPRDGLINRQFLEEFIKLVRADEPSLISMFKQFQKQDYDPHKHPISTLFLFVYLQYMYPIYIPSTVSESATRGLMTELREWWCTTFEKYGVNQDGTEQGGTFCEEELIRFMTKWTTISSDSTSGSVSSEFSLTNISAHAWFTSTTSISQYASKLHNVGWKTLPSFLRESLESVFRVDMYGNVISLCALTGSATYCSAMVKGIGQLRKLRDIQGSDSGKSKDMVDVGIVRDSVKRFFYGKIEQLENLEEVPSGVNVDEFVKLWTDFSSNTGSNGTGNIRQPSSVLLYLLGYDPIDQPQWVHQSAICDFYYLARDNSDLSVVEAARNSYIHYLRTLGTHAHAQQYLCGYRQVTPAIHRYLQSKWGKLLSLQLLKSLLANYHDLSSLVNFKKSSGTSDGPIWYLTGLIDSVFEEGSDVTVETIDQVWVRLTKWFFDYDVHTENGSLRSLDALNDGVGPKISVTADSQMKLTNFIINCFKQSQTPPARLVMDLLSFHSIISNTILTRAFCVNDIAQMDHLCFDDLLKFEDQGLMGLIYYPPYSILTAPDSPKSNLRARNQYNRQFSLEITMLCCLAIHDYYHSLDQIDGSRIPIPSTSAFCEIIQSFVFKLKHLQDKFPYLRGSMFLRDSVLLNEMNGIDGEMIQKGLKELLKVYGRVSPSWVGSGSFEQSNEWVKTLESEFKQEHKKSRESERLLSSEINELVNIGIKIEKGIKWPAIFADETTKSLDRQSNLQVYQNANTTHSIVESKKFLKKLLHFVVFFTFFCLVVSAFIVVGTPQLDQFFHSNTKSSATPASHFFDPANLTFGHMTVPTNFESLHNLRGTDKAKRSTTFTSKPVWRSGLADYLPSTLRNMKVWELDTIHQTLMDSSSRFSASLSAAIGYIQSTSQSYICPSIKQSMCPPCTQCQNSPPPMPSSTSTCPQPDINDNMGESGHNSIKVTPSSSPNPTGVWYNLTDIEERHGGQATVEMIDHTKSSNNGEAMKGKCKVWATRWVDQNMFFMWTTIRHGVQNEKSSKSHTRDRVEYGYTDFLQFKDTLDEFLRILFSAFSISSFSSTQVFNISKIPTLPDNLNFGSFIRAFLYILYISVNIMIDQVYTIGMLIVDWTTAVLMGFLYIVELMGLKWIFEVLNESGKNIARMMTQAVTAERVVNILRGFVIW